MGLLLFLKISPDKELWGVKFYLACLYCILNKSHLEWDFPGGSVGKESACNPGVPSSISVSGSSPREGNGCSAHSSILA